MRILYITDALAVWGGIERVLRDKTSYLVEHYGYDVHIVTTDQGDHSIPYPLDERVHVRDLNIRYHLQYKYHGVNRLLKYWKLNSLFLKRLREAINEIKPEVIVCIRIEVVNTIIKAKGDIPLICESHSLCYAYKYENTSFWHRYRCRRALKWVRKADSVVALTEGDAKDWRRYNDNVRVIPNVAQLNNQEIYSNLIKKIVLFVGRFTAQKDVWSLLEIWKLVYQYHPDWELHAYGEGELKELFERKIKEAKVNIKVFPPTSHIFDKYLEGTIIVMTSLYEPFGLVLPEAMSCGLPVVAFDCPYGPADIISDGRNGFLVKPQDIDLFVMRICELIENPETLSAMSVESIKSSQRYRSDVIMPQWKNLIEQISKIKNSIK